MAEQKKEFAHTQYFNDISLLEKEIKDISRGDKKSNEQLNLLLSILDASKVQKCERKTGQLFYAAALSFQKTTIPVSFIPLIAELITSEKVSAIPRLDMAFSFIKKLKKDEALDQAQLEEFIGVGINITREDVDKAVDEFIKKNSDEINKLRYACPQVNYRNEIEKQLRFPNKKDLFDSFKDKLEAFLGKETEEEKKQRLQAGKKQEKEKAPAKKQDVSAQQQEPLQATTYDISSLSARDHPWAVNTKESLQWKKDKFGEILLSRFPPEPNGYLHLGHCKAINFNFSLAKQYNGACYLRFDDTNPDKENQEYIDSIKHNIEWLGFKPYKVTASSDNFDYLYECAVKLIKKGSAYVCGLSKEESRQLRDNALPSPFRDTPVEENLRLFNNMRMGLYNEGQFSLRAKIDYQNPNTTLRDPVIYRIKYTPHPHSGDKWCIYPLYDFTHPLCDSLEGISYSCCTLEFEIRRDLYYWVLHELDLYRPHVWEYSRLNVSYNVLSKRKMQALIENKIVNGWNDPRLLTMDGMARRGYTPEGILKFVRSLGVTRTSNDTMIPMHYLEDQIREDLDEISIRTLAVIDPILVNITNMKDDEVRVFEAPDFPRKEKSSVHKLEGRNKVYVERSDVIHMAHKDFFGIAPGTLVGLKYFGVFKCTEVKRDENKNIVKVNVEYIHDGTDKKQKPKTFLNWVAAEESQECEVRLYDQLFNHEFPTKHEGNFLETINPENLITSTKARMNKNLKLKHSDHYQFERQGFFAVDYDSNIAANKIVWNRTVKLIEKDRLGALKKVLDDIAKIEAQQQQL